jgi:hypothetical protein
MGIIGRKVMIQSVLESTIAVDPAHDNKHKENSSD